MANQFLSLSLFLMLLAFFVVMNGMASYDDRKAAPILNSLSLAFSNEKKIVQSKPDTDLSDQDDKKNGDALGVVEGLFDAHFANFDVTRSTRGDMMHIRVPLLIFERAVDFQSFDGGTIDAEQKGAFVTTLITLLRSEKKGLPYRVDIILSYPQILEARNTQARNSFRKRLSFIAQTLEDKGLPRRMMSIGLSAAEDAVEDTYVDLYFYPYGPFDISRYMTSHNSSGR